MSNWDKLRMELSPGMMDKMTKVVIKPTLSRDEMDAFMYASINSKPKKLGNVTVNEPLNCPFCGGDEIRFDCHVHRASDHNGRHSGDVIYSTACYNCGATFPNTFNLGTLVSQWKRRPKKPEPDLSHLPTFDPARFDPKP